MKQIGLAMHNFCDVNGGRFPRSTHSGDITKSWIFTLAPIMENVNKIRTCPADPKGEEKPQNDGTSYSMYEYIGESYPPGAIVHLAKLPATSRTIVVFTLSDDTGAAVTEDHTHSSNWFRPPPDTNDARWTRICRDIQPDRFGGRPGDTPAKRLSGVSNYLFADGHVEGIPTTQIRQWSDDGINFAKPAE